MKKRRLLSILMAGMLMAGSVIPYIPSSAIEGVVDLPQPVAEYKFEGTLDSNIDNDPEHTITPVVTGLKAYGGTVTYGEGRTSGKAVQLGDYGLKLNRQNLGDEFTLSLWLKANGTIANNQSVVFLGNNNPEKWFAVAGRNPGNEVKIWAFGEPYSWTEFGLLPLGNDWHQLTITGDSDKIKTYFDGTLAAETESNHPLTGENQDIYLGVTYWDAEFTGWMDDVKVYNDALTIEEIQTENRDYYTEILRNHLDAVTEEDLLGMNENKENVTYDLNLPLQIGSGTVSWTSSDADVISPSGKVSNPARDTQVTLKATVSSGILSVEKQFTFTVKAIDKSSLNALIDRAESLNVDNYTKETADELKAAIQEGKEANSAVAVDEATKRLHKAIAGLVYVDTYADPFEDIDKLAPATEKAVAVGHSEQLFTIPDSVKDSVTVEYFSSDDESATYENGKVTAKKAGRVTVTAIVRAKYNGYVEEYSTALNIMEGGVSLSSVETQAAEEGPIHIRESEINQLLTKDLPLPVAADSKVEYYVEDADSRYVSVEGNTLKITQPYAGEGNYSFTLKADVETNGKTITQEFPLTIAEGISADTFAGYVYVCFGNVGGGDVQQVHFFLSEDGLNWTALNGFNPIFETGSDYADLIQEAGSRNYTVKEGADIANTVKGDASVLFPFEGDDQGIRDPYLLRGCREEDSNKVWILATDLNTMASKYGGNLQNSVVGNWGTMSSQGSTKIFVYETEDWIHWERRYIDVGTEIGAGAAWAPEAVYNPEKDNYLVYWSCRVEVDGFLRNRLYCNETKDFKTFGPTKLYEAEPFYQNWIDKTLPKLDDGFGNIDTSQIWVADEEGNPYGTLYRVVKDETNNHIELMSADTVLDPDVDYDASEPVRITPYTMDGKTYSSRQDIESLTNFQKAEVGYNWFANESVGNHFTKISQKDMEKMAGAYEGATMFKFNDRDEWCVMIDFYGNNSVRYEPYVTTDLSAADSIQKVKSGYGRTGGDVGCHGGMIPITAEEYNTLIDTYNADTTVDNYHPIEYIECDKRELEELKEAIVINLDNPELDKDTRAKLQDCLTRIESMLEVPTVDTEVIESLVEEVNAYLGIADITLSSDTASMKANDSVTITAEEIPEGVELTWSSADEKVAKVKDGKITGVGRGSTFVFARAGRTMLTKIKVTVDKAQGGVFSDVNEDEWFYDAVYYNYKMKTMVGKDDTHFAPYENLARAQFAVILHRIAGEPEGKRDKSFPDVAEGEWYTDAVLWAASSDVEIIKGYTDTGLFGTADNITREQMAVMMYRYAMYDNKDVSEEADFDQYKDADKVSEFATKAMRWAVGTGIITGKDNGTRLDPQGNTSRAECATIIQRFLQYYE